MFSQNNIGFVFIGDNAAYTSATNVSGIGDGEVAVVDAHGTVITTGSAAAGTKFRIVQGRGTGLSPRSTDLIDPSGTNIVKFSGRSHANSQEQITTLGFNGTSGSIDPQNSNRYILRINMIELDRTGFGQQEQIYGTVLTDASATQWEVARELAANVNDNTRKRKERDIQATCLFDSGSATAGTAGIATGEDVNFTNGSDIITAGTSTWTGSPIVGEVVSTDANADVGYEIVEVIDASTARIHMPYQGATATDVDSTAYTAASVAGVDCGIQLTGVERGFDATKPGLFRKVRFETQMEGFGNTTFNATQAPEDGVGNFKQVAKEEYFVESVFGNRYRKDHLFQATIDTDLSGSTYYGVLALKWRTPHQVSSIGTEPVSYKHFKIYVGDGAADSSWDETGVQAADLRGILNTILGTSVTYA